ncbi:hypothetical protein ACFVW8_24290 [Streptomyces sp. NPDC058221]|uniref:hypothetical protein n=1 Tax=Streptomyces sp. NPDC058221 TaxID=3346388 RepID=UPI0036E13DC7
MTVKKSPILVLHDLDTVRAELVIARETADARQRAGLGAALAIVEQHWATTDEQRTREWARRVLRTAGVDPASDHVRAVRTLRRAVPGLGLVTANSLVTSVRSQR